jgi:glyoxylase I family protein
MDMIWMEKIIGDPDTAEEAPSPILPYPALKKVKEEKKGQNTMSKGKLITGIHHAALRCCGEEEMNKAVAFYTDVLGLTIARRWGEGEKSGCMVDTGNGLIEFFADAEPGRKIGPVDHFALATDRVDDCVEAVRKAGFPVTVEPKDVVIASNPPFPARIAFVEGAAGESIELFCEK